MTVYEWYLIVANHIDIQSETVLQNK